MNKFMSISFILGLVLQSGNTYSNGFKGDKSEDANIENWQCQYCPEIESWSGKINTHIGYLDEDENAFHFANYSGIEDGGALFISGDLNMLEDDNYWNTSFQNLGLDSVGLQSEYGKLGSYQIALAFQSIPIRKYNKLTTPFENTGSNQLTLPSAWVQSGDARDYAGSNLFSPFSLETDWDLFNLSFDYSADNNFDYSTSYRRLQKEGIREFSATQILNATFLPLPVDQTTQDFDASASYMAEKWFVKLNAKVSRFDNQIDSVTFDLPYISLANGGEQGSLSTAPDNTFTNISLYTQYNYAPRSFAKLRFSTGQLKQNDNFLPATTNSNLLVALPKANLDGEVSTNDLSLQIHHWFDEQWTLRIKYRDRERDNKSDQLAYQQVVTDAFIGANLTNLPYDFGKETFSAQLDHRLNAEQKISVAYRSEDKTRNFQSIYKTKEDGFSAKYNGIFFEDIQIAIKGELLSRDSSAPQLIDFLGVTENPLMQRFNVADREQGKIDFQVFYNFSETFSATVSGKYAEQDYDKSDIGLIFNQQENINLDLYWNMNETTNFSVYYQQEEIDTELAGSDGFSSPDWQADNLDEVSSYGFNFSFQNLLDNNLNLTFDYSRSDADSTTGIIRSNVTDTLPSVSSQWSNAELKIDYQYSDNVDFALSFQYQEFENSDFAIDGVPPGSLTNLLTYGAFSHNYEVNYVVLSVGYKL